MTKTYLSITALAVFALSACNKTYDPNAGYTLSSAMLELSIKPVKVELDASTGGSFVGSSGTRYTFPPFAFATMSGGIVSGKVSISVSEYLKKTDMIFSDVLPVSGGQPLISGGELDIQATQNGAQLRMTPGATFRANMPVKAPAGIDMQLFNGIRDSSGRINWVPRQPVATAHLGAIPLGSDTVSIVSDSIALCNADAFMANPNFQSFKITLEADGIIFSPESVKVLSLYDNYNGVWPSYGLLDSTNTVDEHHVPDIPVHFVAMATYKGNFYGGILGATPHNGQTYTVKLSKTNPKDFKKQVDAL